MNIIVIGSCIDSSLIAKHLNKRLPNALVARVDALKSIKSLVLNKYVGKYKMNPDLGMYIGDIDPFDLSTLDKNKSAITDKTEIVSKLNLLLDTINVDTRETTPIHTLDALTNSVPTATLSFVKIYSGLITERLLRSTIGNRISSDVVVYVKNPESPLLTPTFTEEQLSGLKSEAFAFVECERAIDFLTHPILNALYGEITDEKTAAKDLKKLEANTVVTTEMVDAIEIDFDMDMAA